MKIYPQITRSIYHIKQDILHKINPQRCQYTLISKTDKVNIEFYNKLSNKTMQNADSFSIVSVGKRDDAAYRKDITTFYSKDKIIARIIANSNGEKTIRTYENKITGLFERYRKVTQERTDGTSAKLIPELVTEYRTYKSAKTGKRKLEIIKNETDGNKITATITEYPFNGGKTCNNFLKKMLGVVLEFDKGYPYITGTIETTNVKFPQNDKFLPFRFIIDKKLKLAALTKFFIKEKNLDKLDIKINYSKNMNKNTAGYFSVSENEITYNINTSSNPAHLCAHEVEHAYQYSQIGRIGKGFSRYEKNSLEKYGKIEGIKESLEAHKYAVAAEKYPQINEDEDLSKNLDYVNNYLEIKANEAGNKAKKEYEELGKEINKQFFFGLP